MTRKSLQFRRVRVIAISVLDSARANKFYAETLGMPPAYEEQEQVGYLIGETILTLKANWDQPPVQNPNRESRSKPMTLATPKRHYVLAELLFLIRSRFTTGRRLSGAFWTRKGTRFGFVRIQVGDRLVSCDDGVSALKGQKESARGLTPGIDREKPPPTNHQSPLTGLPQPRILNPT
jgi:hypothetical protein